jgi:hypothetical protein
MNQAALAVQNELLIVLRSGAEPATQRLFAARRPVRAERLAVVALNLVA